jgi:hypothetical protein
MFLQEHYGKGGRELVLRMTFSIDFAIQAHFLYEYYTIMAVSPVETNGILVFRSTF